MLRAELRRVLDEAVAGRPETYRAVKLLRPFGDPPELDVN